MPLKTTKLLLKENLVKVLGQRKLVNTSVPCFPFFPRVRKENTAVGNINLNSPLIYTKCVGTIKLCIDDCRNV